MDVNQPTVDRRSSLYMAADTGYANTAEILLKNGANINQQADKQHHFSRSPLFCASFNGDFKILFLIFFQLIKIDFDFPLQGHEQIVELLIKYRADLNLPDSNGWTPLNTASSRGEMLKLFH